MSFWTNTVPKLCQYFHPWWNGVNWAMFALDQGLRPVTATRGGTRWSLFRVGHVLSSRTEKPGLAGSKTAPASSAHAHRLACLAASPSATRCQSTKGTLKGCPYMCVSFCNRIEHTNSQGAHKGRPYSRTRLATGPDTLTDRSVSVNNYPLLPLVVL